MGDCNGCGGCSGCNDPYVLPTGPQGPPGNNGTNGTNGTNGNDGTNGTDGADGVGIQGPVGPAGVVSCESVTYEQLLNLVKNNNLVPGQMYCFMYQTIHVIPYTSDVHTGTPETLQVTATSSNTLDYRAKSEDHPEDVVYYQVLDYKLDSITGKTDSPNNLQMDLSTPATPVFNNSAINSTPATNGVHLWQRPGRIYYREDTINKRSTPYDFRGCRFRRWELELTNVNSFYCYTLTNPHLLTSTLANGTSITQGQVIVDDVAGVSANGDTKNGPAYIATKNFDWHADIQSTTHAIYDYCIPLSKVVAIGGSYGGGGELLGLLTYGDRFITHYVTNDSALKLTGNKLIFNASVSLKVDPSLYTDYPTFNEGLTENQQSPANTQHAAVRSHNCHIEHYVASYLEGVEWEFYPNVLFFDHCNDIRVSTMSQNMTFHNANSVRVGSYNDTAMVVGSGGDSATNYIGSNNKDMFIRSQTVGVNPWKIGDNNENILMIASTSVELGSGNESILCSGVLDTKIGNYNQNLSLASNNHWSGRTSNVIIGNSNALISVEEAANNNTIGNGNELILLTPGSEDNTFGNNNYNIYPLLDSATFNEGKLASAYDRNNFEDYVRNVRVSAQDCSFGNNIDGIYCTSGIKFSTCTFEANTGNLNFTGSTSSTISSTTFGWNRVQSLTLKSCDVDTYKFNLNNKEFNSYSVSTNPVGAAMSSYKISTVDVGLSTPTFVTTVIPLT